METSSPVLVVAVGRDQGVAVRVLAGLGAGGEAQAGAVGVFGAEAVGVYLALEESGGGVVHPGGGVAGGGLGRGPIRAEPLVAAGAPSAELEHLPVGVVGVFGQIGGAPFVGELAAEVVPKVCLLAVGAGRVVISPVVLWKQFSRSTTRSGLAESVKLEGGANQRVRQDHR